MSRFFLLHLPLRPIRLKKMKNSKQLLEYAKEQKATDIHICAGAPILFRVNRKLLPVTNEKLTPERSKALAYELLTDEQKSKLEEKLDYDFMLAESLQGVIHQGLITEDVAKSVLVNYSN